MIWYFFFSLSLSVSCYILVLLLDIPSFQTSSPVQLDWNALHSTFWGVCVFFLLEISEENWKWMRERERENPELKNNLNLIHSFTSKYRVCTTTARVAAATARNHTIVSSLSIFGSKSCSALFFLLLLSPSPYFCFRFFSLNFE